VTKCRSGRSAQSRPFWAREVAVGNVATWQIWWFWAVHWGRTSWLAIRVAAVVRLSAV